MAVLTLLIIVVQDLKKIHNVIIPQQEHKKCSFQQHLLSSKYPQLCLLCNAAFVKRIQLFLDMSKTNC